jgi:hypothetical protein
MGVRQVTEDGPGKPTGQVVYVCEICKMETTRHYKAAKISLRNARGR